MTSKHRASSGRAMRAARGVLAERAGGACERCGTATQGDFHAHHRRRRGPGGDQLSNLVAVCPLCHVWIHAHPNESMALGWIIPTYNDTDPAEISIETGRGLIRIDNDGGVTWEMPGS